MDARRAGLRLTWLGAAAQVIGLGLDAWLHARDPGLAAREGVFSLGNVGHSLLVLGIALVVLGAFMSVVLPRLPAKPVLRVGAPIVLVALMGSTTAFAATSTLGQGHDHNSVVPIRSVDGTTTAHSHGATTATTGSTLPGATTGNHTHGDGTVFVDQALDGPTRDELSQQLIDARQAALGHPTVAQALLDGYVMVVPYVPLIGAHYMKFSVVDGRFDVAHPEMLLYDGTNADSRIVGLSYYVRSTSEPAGFAGPNDHWHRHIGLCISQKTLTVIGGEKTTPAQCAAMGGVKADGSEFWMVHAWVVPGWDSPQGVFSAEHQDLK